MIERVVGYHAAPIVCVHVSHLTKHSLFPPIFLCSPGVILNGIGKSCPLGHVGHENSRPNLRDLKRPTSGLVPLESAIGHVHPLSFTVEVSDRTRLALTNDIWTTSDSRAKRAYTTVSTQRRLHQQSFRVRVIQAYRKCCAICRHEELLHAAHILPDGHPRGEPWVSNGLALCKLHHAAFDKNILGVRPDLVVEVRRDVLEESDGPMLQHGLKERHEKRLLVLPISRDLKPRRAFLEERYELFRSGR